MDYLQFLTVAEYADIGLGALLVSAIVGLFVCWLKGWITSQ
jgi:hypothetical protein